MVLIFLWSHPRSMSTAMERLMRERGDLNCFHEPFLYDYYVARKKRVMPHFNAEPGRPVSYDQVRDTLMAAAEQKPVFVKDMSYYVIPHILDDDEFSARLTNTFLIRDPLASIVSYFKLDPEISCEEIGLEAQAKHCLALHESGQNTVVIQAEDVRTNTRSVVNAYWQAIGLSPAEHAFNWQGDGPQDWKQVKGAFNALAKQHPKLQTLLDHHLPFYEMLKSRALQVK